MNNRADCDADVDLRARLAEFDGVHTDTLEAIAKTLQAEPPVLDCLCRLALSDDGKMQSASTWLLKRLVENGARLSVEQTTALLSALTGDRHWEARLHVLQMLGHLSIAAEDSTPLWATLDEHKQAANKLIRAWSYHGLAVLADQHAAYRIEATQLLAAAELDEAASVRARIRRLRKSFTWLRQ